MRWFGVRPCVFDVRKTEVQNLHSAPSIPSRNFAPRSTLHASGQAHAVLAKALSRNLATALADPFPSMLADALGRDEALGVASDEHFHLFDVGILLVLQHRGVRPVLSRACKDVVLLRVERKAVLHIGLAVLLHALQHKILLQPLRRVHVQDLSSHQRRHRLVAAGGEGAGDGRHARQVCGRRRSCCRVTFAGGRGLGSEAGGRHHPRQQRHRLRARQQARARAAADAAQGGVLAAAAARDGGDSAELRLEVPASQLRLALLWRGHTQRPLGQLPLHGHRQFEGVQGSLVQHLVPVRCVRQVLKGRRHPRGAQGPDAEIGRQLLRADLLRHGLLPQLLGLDLLLLACPGVLLGLHEPRDINSLPPHPLVPIRAVHVALAGLEVFPDLAGCAWR
mmetsp:Transcript_142833/g.456159  ORF Transcript_142833/g.456159 Transcript_142833/m.456159 type:complete len:393 (-) Transcript_142833:1370-2548(-)